MPALVPRQITWETIEKSRNQAALPLLAAGLASPSVEVRMQALKALLSRPEIQARKHVLLSWDNFTEPEVDFIGRNTLHFQSAALGILANGSEAEQQLVLTAISQLHLTGCLSGILDIVVDPLHALQAHAIECLKMVCVHWGARARADKDVPSVRGPMLETLYAYLVEFPNHRSIAVVDAWIALVHWDDSLQRGLVGDSAHVAFLTIVDRLNASKDSHALKLLAGYVLRATAPKSIQTLASEKADARLALEFASMVETPNWMPLKRRLRDLPPLACLKTLETGFQECSLIEKRRLWLLMSVSSRDYGQVLRGAAQFVNLGSAEGLQVAAEMVINCRKPEMELMVGDLQCALAGIAKPNSAGPALLEAVLWAQSSSVPLQQAVKALFEGFTVDRLIEQVAQWPTSMCKAMAHVVRATKHDISSYLVKELQSPSPKRRLAALRTTQMLSHSEIVTQHLIPMLDDPQLEVRVRVIDLLSELGGDALNRLLPVWLSDVNTDIQEAAKRVMRRRARLNKIQPTSVA